MPIPQRPPSAAAPARPTQPPKSPGDKSAADITTPNLVSLDQVKTYLGITDSSQDALLNALITTVSYQFLNAINRLDLIPAQDYTDLARGYPKPKLFLKHYPVNSIASVTINGQDVQPWDQTNPIEGGYIFRGTDPNPENRQYIELIGYYTTGFWPYWPYYFPVWPWYYSNQPNIVVAYNAGYDLVPAAIQQAVIDWVAFRRNLSQLQAANPVLATEQIGDYSRGAGTGRVAIDYMGIYIPENVQVVVDQYQRIVV